MILYLLFKDKHYGILYPLCLIKQTRSQRWPNLYYSIWRARRRLMRPQRVQSTRMYVLLVSGSLSSSSMLNCMQSTLLRLCKPSRRSWNTISRWCLLIFMLISIVSIRTTSIESCQTSPRMYVSLFLKEGIVIVPLLHQ